MNMSHRLSPSLPRRLIVVSVMVALSPAAVPAQLPPAHVAEEQALAQIRIHLEQEHGEMAIGLIEAFLDHVPPPILIDQFTFLHAVALHRQGDDTQAIAVLEQFLEEYPASPLMHEAQLRLGELLIASRRPKRAVAVLSQMLNRSPDETTEGKALHQLRRAYELRGDGLRAVQTALTHMAQAGEAERHDLRNAIRSLILQTMDERSLAGVLEAFPATYPGDVASIRLIELRTARGDNILAERALRSFLHQFPTHPYAPTAAALLRSLTARIKAHRHVIAAVLPVSGPMKPFGTEALNGVRLALEQEAFLGPNAIGLVVRDSARSPTRLRRAVDRLIEAFNPIALIGPFSTHEVRRVAEVPHRAAVPFLTPAATLPDVTRLGSYWFSTAMTTPLQITRLVEYAMRNFGYTRFGVLAPRTGHGGRLKHIFQQTVITNGGTVVAEASYQPGTTDASAQIAHLTAQDLRLHGAMVPQAADESDHPALHPVLEDAPLVYVPGFDAIFLPGRPADVAFLSAQLAFLDINVPLLGTNGWNHPNLLTWGHSTMEGGLFVDALFLQSADPDVQHFVTNYRERFQTDPSIFAAQAYDAMHAVLDTVRRGATTGADVREQLSSRRDLPTLGGLSGFDEGGILDRKVYMIHIRNGRLIQLN